LHGPSQGGWVAPIAATRSSPDFVIVAFGLAVSVIDEDREAVVLEMRLKGHGQDTIDKALEVAAAAEAVVESGFTRGFDEFETVRARYRDAPWYKDVHGNFTHFVLAMSPSDLREKGPAFGAPFRDTPFRYDPVPTLAAVQTPQLWVLGGQDLDAPSAETARRITSLIRGGRPITLAIYPNAEHGMTEFEVGPKGERLSTRYAEGYFRLMRDFARDGRVRPPYGDARITRPRR
jgi:pimeloyl-ACP methyl ester carboxylesterase